MDQLPETLRQALTQALIALPFLRIRGGAVVSTMKILILARLAPTNLVVKPPQHVMVTKLSIRLVLA